MMVEQISDIKQRLQARGVRPTKQRLAVAEMVAEAHEPIGANDILQKCVEQNSKIGIATIYRVLSLLEKSGVVNRQPQMSGATVHYSIARDNLGQVVCSRCGKVEEIEQMPGLSKLRKDISRNSQFATTDQSLYIIADCRNDKCE